MTGVQKLKPQWHRRGRDVVAPGERPAGVRATGGDNVVGATARLPGGTGGVLGERDVVHPAPERHRGVGVLGVPGPVRLVVGEQHGGDPAAGGDRADRDPAEVPLVGVEHAGSALTGRVRGLVVLVTGAELAEQGAVGELEVHGGVRRGVGQVAAGELREQHVGQLGVRPDLDVQREQPHGARCRARPLGGVAERVPAGEADAGLGGRCVGRTVPDLDAEPAGSLIVGVGRQLGTGVAGFERGAEVHHRIRHGGQTATAHRQGDHRLGRVRRW